MYEPRFDLQTGQRVKFSQEKINDVREGMKLAGMQYVMSLWRGTVTSVHINADRSSVVVYVKPDMDYEKWYNAWELQPA